MAVQNRYFTLQDTSHLPFTSLVSRYLKRGHRGDLDLRTAAEVSELLSTVLCTVTLSSATRGYDVRQPFTLWVNSLERILERYVSQLIAMHERNYRGGAP